MRPALLVAMLAPMWACDQLWKLDTVKPPGSSPVDGSNLDCTSVDPRTTFSNASLPCAPGTPGGTGSDGTTVVADNALTVAVGLSGRFTGCEYQDVTIPDTGVFIYVLDKFDSGDGGYTTFSAYGIGSKDVTAQIVASNNGGLKLTDGASVTTSAMFPVSPRNWWRIRPDSDQGLIGEYSEDFITWHVLGEIMGNVGHVKMNFGAGATGHTPGVARFKSLDTCP